MEEKVPSFQAKAFWKGTPGPLALTSQEMLEEMKTAAFEMIKNLLRTGDSIQAQIARYKGQLNQWEQRLFDSQRPAGLRCKRAEP